MFSVLLCMTVHGAYLYTHLCAVHTDDYWFRIQPGEFASGSFVVYSCGFGSRCCLERLVSDMTDLFVE